MANALKRPPEARSASKVAALDCREFKSSTASLYVLVDMVLGTAGNTFSFDDRERKNDEKMNVGRVDTILIEI